MGERTCGDDVPEVAHDAHEPVAQRGPQSAVYSRIERGEVDPRLSSLVKIASALDVTLSDLLRGIE